MKYFFGKYLAWVLMIVLIETKGHESCLEKERMGLLKFKQSLESINEDAHWLLPSWVDDPRSDCCGWERVTCTFTTRRVSQLSLNNVRHVEYYHKLLGYALMDAWFLNVSLFTPFEELVSLDLSENWFKGCMENDGFDKLSNLKKLEMLNLGMNDFDNSILPSLGSLTTLKSLVLRETKLEGPSPATELANLRNLEMLDLSYCFLNSRREPLQMQGFERLSTLKKLRTLALDSSGFDNRIFSYLSSFIFLKNLSLSYNQLGGSFPPRDLVTLRSLEILNLGGNNFNESQMDKGSRSISNMKKLQTLDLSLNKFNKSILHSLSALPSLRNLMLGSNNLSGSFPTKELSNFGDLETLDLRNTSLSGPITIQDLAHLRNLKTLILRDNQLGGTIPAQAFNNLEVLDLRKNNFIESIPSSIWHMSSLRVLSLANNELNGTLPVEGLCNMENLEELDLSLNMFEGKLPPCLKDLKSLRVLDLSLNQFTGNFSSSLISNLTSLEYIDISYNGFKGLLSLSSFANHSNLEGIILSSDNDKFEVEADYYTNWVPMFQLKILVLSQCNLNKLTGSIPKFLSQQYKLIKLDLSHNGLKGEFPKWILQNNRILEFLNLRNNSLSGKFPLPSYPNRYNGWLDVSHNHFNGSLERNFGEIFPFLAYLNLSGNSFQGPIPSSIGNKSTMEALDLSGNSFSGEVPEELVVGSINLSVMKLSRNRLQGHISSTQFNLPALQLLHLDNNQFTGSLSDGLAKCSQLLLLDVSNNFMSGEVPRWIHGMKNLSTLIMRNNSFHGHVPYGLESIQFLDLSHNLFTGSLPSLTNLKYVQHVHLQGNRFTGLIPKNFLNASVLLITLDLGENNLSGHVPNSIGAFSNLRVLSLRGNNFSGEISTSFCELRKISIMDLSYNSFSGQVPNCFINMTFGEIGTNDRVFVQHFLSGLEKYSFYIYAHPLERYFVNLHERVHGSHSHELDGQYDEQDQIDFITKSRASTYSGGILNYMSGLDLSCNNLIGEIPYDLGMLSWIRALNLSHNSLTGSIPPSFSNLSQLESLDLSYNNLSGKIPSELTDLHFLAVFTVAHNNLSGRVPDMEAQFGTFDESSYVGNPFLCGPLLKIKCENNTDKSTNSPTTSSYPRGEKWYEIDPIVFVSTFVASYFTILSVFAALLCINPYWRIRWFYLIEECLYTCYYFVLDAPHKLSVLLFK